MAKPGKDLEALAEELDAREDYRVLRKIGERERYAADDGAEKRLGIYLDVETTGFDPGREAIIELAMLQFEFSSDGKIYRVVDEYDGFEDPGRPIPEEIVELTGITDDDVAGKAIDEDTVREMLEPAAIVIAHNARFDRPFVENRLAEFREKAWGCSANQVPWRRHGIESAKLEYVGMRLGFFFEPHRAIADCRAGLEILSRDLPQSEQTVLNVLLDNARKTGFRLWATDSPFESRHVLKSRGYRWNPGEDGQPKAWYIDLEKDQLAEEQRFLDESIYRRHVELPTKRINAFNRFSERI